MCLRHVMWVTLCVRVWRKEGEVWLCCWKGECVWREGNSSVCLRICLCAFLLNYSSATALVRAPCTDTLHDLHKPLGQLFFQTRRCTAHRLRFPWLSTRSGVAKHTRSSSIKFDVSWLCLLVPSYFSSARCGHNENRLTKESGRPTKNTICELEKKARPTK